jgi:hypothetical protein
MTSLATAPEDLVCRYLLGFKRIEDWFLDAICAWMDDEFVVGTSKKVRKLLASLAPWTPPGAGRTSVVRTTAWTLTEAGLHQLGEIALGRPTVRHRLAAMRCLVAFGLLGAMPPSYLANAVRSALLANAMEGGWNRQPTGAPARAKDVVVLASTIEGVLAFGDHRLLIRLAGPSDTPPSEVGHRQALGHLRAQGLAEEVVVEETVRPGNLVTQTMVAAMRRRHRRGELELSDLAAAILYRRVDRAPTQHRASSQRKPDSRVLKRVLLAQMRRGEAPVAAIEQATLSYDSALAPSFATRSPKRTRRTVRRRTDMALWRPGDPPEAPSLLVELERRNRNAPASYERAFGHVEKAVMLSAGTHRPVELVFVAEAYVRPRLLRALGILSVASGIRAVPSLGKAEVTLRVVRLSWALRHGVTHPEPDEARVLLRGRYDLGPEEPTGSPLRAIGAKRSRPA